MNTAYSRRFSTTGYSLKGLFCSVIVTISPAEELTISRSFFGIESVIFQGSTSSVLSMDQVSAHAFEQNYFHAEIVFKDGRSYELPLPPVELSKPGTFEELRSRIGLTGEYATVEGKLPRWDRLITPATATA